MDSTQKTDRVMIGQTNFRDERKRFGIKKQDRRYHMYVIGKTGTGKSTLLENMILQDINHGEGLAVLDPHGDFVENIAGRIPEWRKNDIVYFNTPDPACLFRFNPLESVEPDRRPLAASEMIEAFKKIWEKTWGARMEHIYRNTLLTLLDQPRATLADVGNLYTDETYRREAIARVTNPEVLKFWSKEFHRWTPQYRIEALNPIQNKVGAFLANPHLHRVLTEPGTNIDIRKIMDEGKVLLVNLAKGKLGGDNSSLLGSLLVSRIGLAALSRADIQEKERRDFYLYLDEFQNFTTLSMANMLSELRKYRLNIIISHQYLDQLEPEIQNAILGNIGTIMSFRIGLKDAHILAKEFYPVFNENDLVNLPNYSIYLKLMIDGRVSKPFSAETISPIVVIHNNPEIRRMIGEMLTGNDFPCHLASSWEEGMRRIADLNPGMVLSGDGVEHWIERKDSE